MKKRHFFKKIFCILQFCCVLTAPANQLPLNDLAIAKEQFSRLDETELKKIVSSLYAHAKENNLVQQLPPPFLLCYELLQNDSSIAVQRDDLIIALDSAFSWLTQELEATKTTRSQRPEESEKIIPVGPNTCCNFDNILRLLAIINAQLGSTGETACSETVLGILGDACAILGTNKTISSGIKDALTCCNDTFTTVVSDFNQTWTILATITTNTSATDLSGIYTTLGNAGNILGKDATISGTLLDISRCCATTFTTVVTGFNNTWTALAPIASSTITVDFSAVFTALKAVETCCSNLTATVLREFNETWTILNAIQTGTVNVNFSTVFTAIASIQTCCSNLTATVLREFNETWTILNTIQTQTPNVNLSTVFTAIGAIQNCCTNLTATVLREFNETWTILDALGTQTVNIDFSKLFTAIGAIQTCCTNLTATVLREFNETWSILANLHTPTIFIVTDTSSIFTMLSSIERCCNNLTATVLREFNETFTIIAVSNTPTVIVNVDFSQVFTALAALQTCCSNLTSTVLREFNETWTIIATTTILVDLSTLFTALAPIQTCCTNLTATVLREFNETWTILNTIQTQTLNVNFSPVFSALKSVEICCSNLTATVLREFNETWTILNAISTGPVNANFSTIFTALKSVEVCCSNLTATVLREFNETWTILNAIQAQTINVNFGTVFTALAPIQTCCTNLTATVLREFNETWTILTTITNQLQNVNFSTVFTALKAVENCCSNLTATVLRDFNETWTILNALSTQPINISLSTVFTVLNVLTASECSPVLIRQTDVNTTTFTISKPNRYILAENITFNPAAPQRAIDITSSNVTIDLLCRVLSQGTTTTGVDAIRVASNLSDITITNGTIQNFKGKGITVNQGCSFVTVDNLLVFSCETRGIEFLGASGANNQISRSNILNTDLRSCCQGASGDIVLTLSHCNNVLVQGCAFDDNGILQHNLDVANLNTCTNCRLQAIEMSDNIASGTVRGFNLIDTTQCLVQSCVTNNLYSSRSDAYGIDIGGMDNLILSNILQNTYSTAQNYSNVVTGISLQATASGNNIFENIVTNSVALASTSSAVPVYGLRMLETEVLNTTDLPNFALTNDQQATVWSPDEKFLATGDTDGNLKVYQFVSNRIVPLATVQPRGAGVNINTISWSPDGSSIFVGSDNDGSNNASIYSFNSQGLTLIEDTELGNPGNNCRASDWSLDGRFIAVAVGQSARIFDFQDSALREVGTFVGVGSVMLSVHFSSDQQYLAFGAETAAGNIGVLRVAFTSTVPTTLVTVASDTHGNFVHSVRFHPANEYLAIGGVSGTGTITTRIFRFNGSSLTPIATFNHGATVRCVRWSPDGYFLAQSGTRISSVALRLFKFENETLSLIQNFDGGENLFQVTWAPGGTYLAIGGITGSFTLKILNALQFAKNCFIQRNNITMMQGGNRTFGIAYGTGLLASQTNNFVVQNLSFNNNTNFVFVPG